MDFTQFITFIFSVVAISATNIGLFLWARSESRSDYRHLEANIKAMEGSTTAILQAIRDDIKDFHGRLCAIEEKHRSK